MAARPRSTALRALQLPAGFAFGAAAGFLQQHAVYVGELRLPVGVLLMVACLVVFTRYLVVTTGSRLDGAAFVVGWLIATVLMALPTPSGDVVLSGEWHVLLYIGAGSLLAGAAAAWPPPAGGPSREAPAPAPWPQGSPPFGAPGR